MGKWLFTELYWVSHFPRVRCFLQICSANLWWTICIKNEKSMECWMRWCLILANVDIDSVQSLANVGMHAAFKTRWHCWWIGAQLYKTWRTLRVSRGLRRPTVRPPFRCDGFKRLWIKTGFISTCLAVADMPDDIPHVWHPGFEFWAINN